jgi:uncharacterized protein YeaO (DUF488 family)
MIYTSYFANLKKLPPDVIPISICGKAPDWYKGVQYKKLAPKYDFFMEWKKTHDNDYYIEHFQKEVLDTLDINQVLRDLLDLSKTGNIALICFEKPTDFCHRHLVADWLNQNGLDVKEYKSKTKENANDKLQTWLYKL